MWRRWGPQKFTMAYRIFLQLDINCSIFHVIFLWRCLDLDSNFAYHWTSFGFSCGTTKLPNQGIYLGLFICFGKCLQIGEVGLSKPSTANASISKCEWNVVGMSNEHAGVYPSLSTQNPLPNFAHATNKSILMGIYEFSFCHYASKYFWKWKIFSPIALSLSIIKFLGWF